MRTVLYALWLSCSLLLPTSVHAQPADSGQPVSEEVTFAGGDIPLAGTLHIPPGAGPFPGVVIVHGSGSSDRSNPWTSAYAAALVARGVAVLHPDKRGSGASGGNWLEAGFLDLADDALAAFDLLRAHPKVDSARVGLIGFSQGGHVVPAAAARSSAVAFVANVSGSVVPIREQIRDEIRQMGVREGLTEDELETLREILDRAEHYARTGEGWSTYAAALAEAKAGGLGGTEVVGGFTTDPEAPVWGFLRKIVDFDPLPFWREVEVPALFLYGGKDTNVDVYKSADLIEEVLTPTDLSYSLLLFRNNGHALYREDAMDFIARWMHEGGAD